MAATFSIGAVVKSVATFDIGATQRADAVAAAPGEFLRTYQHVPTPNTLVRR